MDQELQMIEYLLNDVKQEIQNHRDYKKALDQMYADYERAKLTQQDVSYLNEPWCYLNWNKAYPKKAKITDYLKMIRRLTLKIEKELQEEF